MKVSPSKFENLHIIFIDTKEMYDDVCSLKYVLLSWGSGTQEGIKN